MTICTKDRIDYFGKIENGEMRLNDYGKIANENLLAIPDHLKNVIMNEFIVMPNHIHAIIGIFDDHVGNAYMHSTKNVENRNAYMRSLQKNADKTKMTLSKIIQQYKASVTREINSDGTLQNYFQWQKSFHDHIIRNDKSLNNIREYIYYNPIKWEWDIENITNKNPDTNYYTKLFVC